MKQQEFFDHHVGSSSLSSLYGSVNLRRHFDRHFPDDQSEVIDKLADENDGFNLFVDTARAQPANITASSTRNIDSEGHQRFYIPVGDEVDDQYDFTKHPNITFKYILTWFYTILDSVQSLTGHVYVR